MFFRHLFPKFVQPLSNLSKKTALQIKRCRDSVASFLSRENFRSWAACFKKKWREASGATSDFMYRWLVSGLFLISVGIYVVAHSGHVTLPSAAIPYIDLIPEFIWAPCLFYFFFYLREKRANSNLKHVSLMAYSDFKRSVIMQFQFLLDGASRDPERFFDLAVFRKEFGEDNWYKIANAIEERDLQVFRAQAKFLREELTQLLGAKRTTSKRAFTMLKILCWKLSDLESVGEDYDGRKALLRELWSLFSGWSFGTGYSDRDLVEKAIHDL